MKKLISLFLTLTTVFACLSMAIIPGAAEGVDGAQGEATPAPEVWFGGHQRTVVADTTYGIRLIGLTNDLSADEVGFSVEVIRNDGKIATYEENITTVYTAITAYKENVETTITAESLGAKYIFTLVLDEIDPNQGFWGYRVSTYYKIDTVKHFGDTHEIVYKGSERYVTKVTGKVQPKYDGCSTGTWVDWSYADGSKDRSKTDEAVINDYASQVWDGTISGSNYGGFTNTAEAYSQARFDAPTVIESLKLSAYYPITTNENAKIQASVNGEDWIDLCVLTKEKYADFLTHDDGWVIYYQAIEITDRNAYNYIRAFNPTKNGFSFCEVEVYGTVEIKGEEARLNLSNKDKQNSSFGTDASWAYAMTGNQTPKYPSTGDGSDPALLWDGTNNAKGWGYYGITGASGAYSSVEFDNSTVISKVTVATSACGGYNVGAQIQASVNGQDWDSLHTFNRNVSKEEDAFLNEKTGEGFWSYNPAHTFTFSVVKPTTEYKHIRVFGTQYCLSEIQVYGIKESYLGAPDFAAAWNAGDVVETDPNKIVPMTFVACGANGTKGEHYDYNGHDQKSEQTTIMWDGNIDRSYSGMWTWGDGANSAYSIAKMDNAAVIDRIVLVTSDNHDGNIGVKIWASKDGTDNSWVELYAIGGEKDKAFVTKKEGVLKYLEIDVVDSDDYQYIKVQGGTTGFYFNEVQVVKAAS